MDPNTTTAPPPNPRDLMYQEAIEAQDARNLANQQAKQEQQEAKQDDQRQRELVRTIEDSIQTLINFERATTAKVQVTNQKDFPTSISTPDVSMVVSALQEVKKAVDSTKPDNSTVVDAIKSLKLSVEGMPKAMEFPQMPEPVEDVNVKNFPDYKPDLTAIASAVKGLDVKPKVNVSQTQVDTSPITKALKDVVDAIQAIPTPTIPKIDNQGLKDAINEVKKTIENLIFPVPNFRLPFTSATGADTTLTLDSNNNLPVMPESGMLPFMYDDMEFTNPDAGSHYQTITVKRTGATIATLNLLYDGAGNVTSIARV